MPGASQHPPGRKGVGTGLRGGGGPFSTTKGDKKLLKGVVDLENGFDRALNRSHFQPKVGVRKEEEMQKNLGDKRQEARHKSRKKPEKNRQET